MAFSSEELQRPADGGKQQSECGRVLRAPVVPGETPAAETSLSEAETGEPEGSGQEEQPPSDPPLVPQRTQRLFKDTEPADPGGTDGSSGDRKYCHISCFTALFSLHILKREAMH